MDRARKEQVVAELGQIFESSGVVVVARYKGLRVADMQRFRRSMRDAGGSVRVAKNRLSKIALAGSRCEAMAGLMRGMTLLAYSEDSVTAAKVVDEFASSNSKLVILGGSVGSTFLDAEGVRSVARMPSREEMLSILVSCILSPAANIASAVGAPASNIASILSEVEERAAA